MSRRGHLRRRECLANLIRRRQKPMETGERVHQIPLPLSGLAANDLNPAMAPRWPRLRWPSAGDENERDLRSARRFNFRAVRRVEPVADYRDSRVDQNHCGDEGKGEDFRIHEQTYRPLDWPAKTHLRSDMIALRYLALAPPLSSRIRRQLPADIGRSRRASVAFRLAPSTRIRRPRDNPALPRRPVRAPKSCFPRSRRPPEKRA